MASARLTWFPRLAGASVYALVSLAGLAVILYPLWGPALATDASADPRATGPLVLAAVVGFCFAALALEASSSGLGARTVAALGVLVALNSMLRFVEVALPGPGGFSPVFFLIIVTGYAFGARFGFLMGALTMGVSAVLTGGVGPWLPYQMLVAGWVGLTSGWLPGGRAGGRSVSRAEVVMLAAFGAAWGFLYGILMTPWFWMYVDPGAATGGPVLPRFLTFYAATSLIWDTFRALGTLALVAVAGRSVLGALRRLGRWFDFTRADPGPPPGPRIPEAPADLPAGTGAPLHPGSAAPPADVPYTEAAPEARSPSGRPAIRVRQGEAVNPYAWLVWVTGVAALASVTRNALILAAAILAVAVVRAVLSEEEGREDAVPLVRFAVVVIAFSALYNLLALHAGDTVVARLPGAWPVIGGPLTLEALALGVATGLSLVTLLAAFATFQRALSARALTRLVPRAFGALALVSAIALTYVPSVRRQLTAVREAQAVRGHQARGLGSWIVLSVPLLAGGLERSGGLAESMTARGLMPPEGASWRPRAAVLAGLGLALIGWLGAAITVISGGVAALFAVTGAVVAGLAMARLGRRARYNAYRRAPWRASDTAVAAAAWAPILVGLAMPSARAALAHTPFPQLSLPPLDPVLVLALAGLAAPAVPLHRWARQGGAVGNGRQRPAPPGAAVAPARPADVRFSAYGYAYPRAGERVLRDIDLDLPSGEMTLLTGASGVGKSTLLRAMNGLVPHFTGGTVWGAVAVAGRDPLGAGPAAMSDAVGFVAGDPESAFVLDVVEDEVAFALEHRGLPRPEMRQRVADALARVGLRGFEDRRLVTLSGGERQRVAVAAALALTPRVLVLDEPTSQLDDASAADVLDAVVELAAAHDLTVVLSEHRIDRVAPYARLRVHLAAPGARPLVGRPSTLAQRVDTPSAPAAPPPAPGRSVLACRGLGFGYEGRRVLRDASLTVRAGEVVALTGPSGAGKTTLLRLAVGLLRPLTGDVSVDGAPIAGQPVAQVCRRVGYLPQDPGALLFADTVMDELLVTLTNHGLDGDARGRAAALLADLGIEALAHRYPRDLSTGQRQRVALGAVAVTDPAVLLLDEPTRGLDGAAIARLARILHARAEAGTGVLVATHDRRLIRAAHRTLCLVDGHVEPGALGRAAPTADRGFARDGDG